MVINTCTIGSGVDFNRYSSAGIWLAATHMIRNHHKHLLPLDHLLMEIALSPTRHLLRYVPLCTQGY